MNGKNYFKAFSAFFVLILLASGCCQTGTETPSVTNYTVTFKPNPPAGATGAEKLKDITKTYAAGSTLQFQTDLFSLEGYHLIGWANTATSDTPSYKAGNTFEVRENKSFYAVWEIETVTGFVIKNNVIVEFKRELGYTEVTIPATVTSIQKNVLKDSGITKIDYKGNKAAWDKLVNDSDIAADLNGITVICSDGTWNPDDPSEKCEHSTITLIPAKAATCEEKGNEAYYTCASCGKFFKDEAGTQEITDKTSIEIAPLNHNFGPDGACTICGKRSTTVDGIVYTYISDYGYYEVSGTSDTQITKATIKNEINGVPVTRIGDKAFKECRYLTSVTIPDSITSIGEYAFDECQNLTSITIPDGVTTIGKKAFCCCYELTSVTIPDGITTIGRGTFSNCFKLTNVTIPDSVTSIAYGAFNECDKLASITIPDSVTSTIGRGTFQDCKSLTSAIIGSGVTSIDSEAFKNCESLASVTIGSGVTSIAHWAFEGCDNLTSLTVSEDNETFKSYENCIYTKDGEELVQAAWGLESVTIPNGVTSIGEKAFWGHSKLTSVTIGNDVTTIGQAAFSRCNNLTGITIPDSVTSIKKSAFYNCSKLTAVYYGGTEEQWQEITIEDNNTCLTKATIYYTGISLPSYTFSEDGKTLLIYNDDGLATFKSDSNYDSSKLTSVTILDGATTISDSAFSDCTSLTNVIIPGSVTSIDKNAFSDCSSLTSLTVSENNEAFKSHENCIYTKDGKELVIVAKGLTSVTILDGVISIGDSVFSNYTSLRSVTIPDSVTSIGKNAFKDCSKLTSVTIGSGVATIGDSAFEGSNNLTSLTVSENNETFKSHANCIYTKDGKELVIVAKGLTKSVAILDGVISIGDSAFSDCSKLTIVTIPDSVTSIGENAFKDCSSLVDVYYGNTEERWKGITIGSGNDCLSNATMHYDDPSYTLDDSGMYLKIHDNNGFTAYKNDSNYRGKSFIKSVKIDNGVTTIGSYAFLNCENLEEITIPDSVTSIGDQAFMYCGRLAIIIPNSITSIGNYAFSNCNFYSIHPLYSNFTIPDSVTSIGNNAFYNCYFEEVTIGSGVTSIGSEAFALCDNLKKITISEGVTVIGKKMFSKCNRIFSITIPDSVTSIGDYAFDQCEDLRNVTFGAGSSLTSIGDYAFSKCSRLNDVTLPDSVTSIGEYAFQYCNRFTSVTIPGGVTSISKYAYYNCTSLTSITLPDNVTSIGMAAFKKCNWLRCVTFGDGCSLTSIGYEAFAETKVDRNIKTGNSFTIPDSVTSIDEYAFKDNIALTNITIPNSVTSIEKGTFSGCSKLTSVTIPDSVTTIGGSAFKDCSSLTSVTIPDSVTSIGSFSPDSGGHVFEGCSSLKSIVIPKDVTDIRYSTFKDCSSLTSVTIPSRIVQIYGSAFSGCSSLASITFLNNIARWNNYIIKASDWDSNTGNYTVYCTDGNISK